MIALLQIEEKIREKLKVDYIKVIDLRGGDHIQLVLVSPDFEGKSLVEQHKEIYQVLEHELKSNQIHALTLKTYSPTQWEKIKPTFTTNLGHEI